MDKRAAAALVVAAKPHRIARALAKTQAPAGGGIGIQWQKEKNSCNGHFQFAVGMSERM